MNSPTRSFPSLSGPVAQLGARFHGMEEVVGSIPTRSTNTSITSVHNLGTKTVPWEQMGTLSSRRLL